MTQGTIFFGTVGSLALGWFPGQPVGVLEFAVHGKKPLGNWQLALGGCSSKRWAPWGEEAPGGRGGRR